MRTAQAAASFVMGGPSVSLAPNSQGWSWDGTYVAGYRGAVTNSAYFGPSGTVQRTITATTLTSINAGSMSGLNAFIAPWWYSSDSAAYNQTVVNFFLGGGALFLLDDMGIQSGIATQLGIPTHDSSDGSVSNGVAPLFSGPFGTATNVTQTAEHGYLVASEITSHGGFVCSVNASSQITAACFNAGAYAAGAGPMVITTDVDMITTSPSGTAVYGPLNANAVFALNATAFLLTGTTPTTPTNPTASAPALSDFGLVGLAGLLIASATILIGRRTN